VRMCDTQCTRPRRHTARGVSREGRQKKNEKKAEGAAVLREVDEARVWSVLAGFSIILFFVGLASFFTFLFS
jgi:hypothetical protein